MYITRNIDKNLNSWSRSSSRCPLILRGARQVGKSASVNALGRSFANQATADFEADPRLHEVFAGKLTPQSLISQLEALLEVRIEPGKTLLFLDEIQECPRAIASLRYFKELMPSLHVIAAGSLLEFALGEISFPVGRVEYRYLYPMSFDEFLIATDRSVLAQRRPRGHRPHPTWELPPAIGLALQTAMKEYVIVGGMPEAVATFVKTRSFLEVMTIHDRLVQAFRDDIPKYASGVLQKRNVSQVFTHLAAAVGEQVTYTKLVADDSKRNKSSVFLLAKAMLVHLTQAASPAGLPLAATADEAVFKPVFLDIGLMHRLCGLRATDILAAKDLLASFQGRLAEQFVGQELLATGHGSESGRLFYWRRAAKSSSAEVDYLIVRDHEIVPLEVKSGASGKLRSLHLLLDTFPEIENAVCLQSVVDCSTHGRIHFLPLFASLDETKDDHVALAAAEMAL